MPVSAEVLRRAQQRYWRANVTVMVVLLLIWAFVGLGCGILWADWLNDLGKIGGVPLGFWFAQQGSIATFVLIILFYAITMNRLDAKYHREVKAAEPAKPQAAAEGGDA
ncbi:MAG: DUF4212 domain-containing protein [Planctomycetota bacterium]